MRSFIYDALPGRVLFANGAFERVPDELERLGAARVLLIADRMGRAWADGLADRLAERVVARIDDVRVHVPVERAEAARAMARDAAADAIVTIGGGSATGLGKAVALDQPLRILAVPTTYAGSEMTPIWGLTEGERKYTGRDPVVQPTTVVYDPLLTLTLPPAIAGPSGMNALAHCAEAIYAEAASPITTLMAEEGIRVLSEGLPRVVARPDDVDARGDVLMGAYLAGAAFAAAGSGIHHKICHVLGGAYDLPHAEMHTVILPHALAFNAPAVPAAMARMARAIGNPDVPGAVFDLARMIGAPRSLAEIGMPMDRLDEAARLIVEAVPNNPRPVDEPAIRSLLVEAYRGASAIARPGGRANRVTSRCARTGKLTRRTVGSRGGAAMAHERTIRPRSAIRSAGIALLAIVLAACTGSASSSPSAAASSEASTAASPSAAASTATGRGHQDRLRQPEDRATLGIRRSRRLHHRRDQDGHRRRDRQQRDDLPHRDHPARTVRAIPTGPPRSPTSSSSTTAST